jgi:CRP/FNR family cyclic AMP-dependent transcriptional regulator
MAGMDLVGALLATELFEGFRREDLEPVHLGMRVYQKGASLWHAGDPVVALYLVSSGLVKVHHIETDGSEIVIDLIVPGETVGEYWVFEEDARRVYDAVAVERTEVVVVPREHLLYQLERRPKLTMTLAASLLRRMSRQLFAIAEIQQVDLDARLARRLLGFTKVIGQQVEGGTRIGMRLSQSLLAGTVRASREHVNRALARFTAAGLIEHRNGYIVVTDAEALLECATGG